MKSKLLQLGYEELIYASNQVPDLGLTGHLILL